MIGSMLESYFSITKLDDASYSKHALFFILYLSSKSPGTVSPLSSLLTEEKSIIKHIFFR